MLSGIINLNKPSGMTSNDAVVKARGCLRVATGEKHKVGHLGTLDPMAKGVLPITVGRATRLFDLLSDKKKKYTAVFKFGSTTDTLDSEGEITLSGAIVPKMEDIIPILPEMCGKQMQIPPLYSAKSVGGKRAYQLARQGKEVCLAPKEVEIYDIQLLENNQVGCEEYAFEITCGSGTYIRSIARDMAAKLNTVAHMTDLVRNMSGIFTLDKAISFDTLQGAPLQHLIPLEEVLAEYPQFDIPADKCDAVINGVKIEFPDMPNGVFIVKARGDILGIAKSTNDKILNLTTRLL